MSPPWLGLATACTAMVAIAACGGDSKSDQTRTTRPKTPVIATTTPTDGNPDTTDGRFDINGHEMFLACRGTGSPTFIYVHGMGGTAEGGSNILDRLGDGHRRCAYDRPNGLGVSETVDGPLTGQDSVEDLHALLAAADVQGPYVLLGASFGGLISDMYAATYPDDVMGMMMLDSPLPDALVNEARYIPEHDRLKASDWKKSPERMDELTTFHQAQRLQGVEPRIPLTYLAVKRLDLPPSYPRKAITMNERRKQREFVARFSPGRLVLVDSPHYMEPEIPGRIAREVNRILAATDAR